MKKHYLLFSMTFTLTLFATGVFLSPASAKTEKFIPATDRNYFALSAQSEDCNTKTYKIYPEAAKMWNTSWLDVFAQDTSGAIRTLTTEDLNYLYSQYKDAPNEAHGLRFYYGIADEGHEIPNLMIANTISCQYKPDADGMILLVTPEGSRKIPLDSAKEYATTWKLKSDVNNRTSVYAYNYRWDQIKELVGENLDTDMHIVYGLRTLSPDENKTEFQLPEVNKETGEILFGSIVYVNVLYTGERDFALTDDDEQFDNFARPCPRFCDPDTTNTVVYR